MKIRSSRLPLAVLCTPSILGEISIGGDRGAADMGTAVHDPLADYISGGSPDIARFSIKHQVDLDELGKLYAFARASWDKLKQWFPNAETEVQLQHTDGDIYLTGHADVMCLVGNQVRILDFKSGRLDSDHEAQMRGYAFLGLQKYPQATSVWVVILRIRDFESKSWKWDRDEVEAWWTKTANNLLSDKEYRPGRHCGHCPRGSSCPAKTQLVRQSIQSFLETEIDNLPTEAADRGQMWAEFLDRCKLIGDMIEAGKNVARADILERGGTLPTKDGREVILRTNNNREILLPTAYPILEKALGKESLLGVLSASVGKTEKAIGDTAGRGQKTKEIKSVFDELESAGAIARKPVQRLEVKMAKLAIEN
jgi:hypothetical protein